MFVVVVLISLFSFSSPFVVVFFVVVVVLVEMFGEEFIDVWMFCFVCCGLEHFFLIQTTSFLFVSESLFVVVEEVVVFVVDGVFVDVFIFPSLPEFVSFTIERRRCARGPFVVSIKL